MTHLLSNLPTVLSNVLPNLTTVVFIVLTILLLFSYMYIIWYNFLKCRNDLKLVQYIVKTYLRDFDKICSENNIKYWADSGTLLGAVREGGMIPHDDDIDVCILEEDYEKLSMILKDHPIYKLPKNGYIDRFTRRDIENIYIDVFVCNKKDGVIRYSDPENIKRWPKMFYKEEELFPLKRVKFNDLEIPIPDNPVPYLERSYGNWKTPVVWSRH